MNTGHDLKMNNNFSKKNKKQNGTAEWNYISTAVKQTNAQNNLTEPITTILNSSDMANSLALCTSHAGHTDDFFEQAII